MKSPTQWWNSLGLKKAKVASALAGVFRILIFASMVPLYVAVVEEAPLTSSLSAALALGFAMFGLWFSEKRGQAYRQYFRAVWRAEIVHRAHVNLVFTALRETITFIGPPVAEFFLGVLRKDSGGPFEPRTAFFRETLAGFRYIRLVEIDGNPSWCVSEEGWNLLEEIYQPPKGWSPESSPWKLPPSSPSIFRKEGTAGRGQPGTAEQN
ncbi:MAG: hypothetical protein KBD16_00305 [Candidatus Pacebacteria bacterium]|nr:hypothetical protein [Candidatus Paceibacterota bacterium]